MKFIKLDICAEEMHNGSPAAVALVGHARGVMAQLNQVIADNPGIEVKQDSAWWQTLAKKVQDNSKVSAELLKKGFNKALFFGDRDLVRILRFFVCSGGSTSNTTEGGLHGFSNLKS